MPNTIDIHYESPKQLVLDPAILTDTVVPTADTEYKIGDLLIVAADTNAATHSETAADWHVICKAKLTAEETNKKIADGKELPVYIAGKYNVDAVTMSGVELDGPKKLAARAYALRSLSVKLAEERGV